MMFKESRPKVNEQVRVLSAQSDASQFIARWRGRGDIPLLTKSPWEHLIKIKNPALHRALPTPASTPAPALRIRYRAGSLSALVRTLFLCHLYPVCGLIVRGLWVSRMYTCFFGVIFRDRYIICWYDLSFAYFPSNNMKYLSQLVQKIAKLQFVRFAFILRSE